MRTLVMVIATLSLLGVSARARAEEPAKPGNPSDSASDTMDLTDEKDAFAPYSNERHPAWALLPAAAIAIVLLHLRKSKPQPKLVRRDS
jgi:hypothetical protein